MSARRPTHGIVTAISSVLTLFALAACAQRADTFAYSGTVQADAAQVGSITGGRVVSVPAYDGLRVSKGAVVVRFDDRQLRPAYDAAVAQAAQASAALRDLEAGPRQADIDKAAAAAAQAQAGYARARLDLPSQVSAARQAVGAAQADASAARANAATAARDYQRAKVLYAEGAISAQARDAARAAAASAAGASGSATARLRTAQAQLAAVQSGSATQDVVAAAKAADAAQANLDLVRLGARPEQITQARAAASAAMSDVAAAKARLDETSVTAPADGVVDALDLHPGDLVAAGAPVATIDEFGDPWVRIYVEQSAMQHVRVGAAVKVRSDAQNGAAFDGRVESIDATAQFTPRDVQTASDRADLAFGVKVRIHDPGRVLRAGTTVDVSLR
jgi:HlyD family secretion protein